VDENPYESPQEPEPVEGGTGLFVALLLTALAMGMVFVGWIVGFLPSGVAILLLLVLGPLLLWLLTESQRRARRASGLETTSLSVAQTLLVAAAGILSAAATFLAVCGGTALGAETLVGGYDALGIMILGLFAGILIGVIVGIWAGWKTYRAIQRENQKRIEPRASLEPKPAGQKND
jgi:uncharacterized Tic20 family protein